MLDIDYKDAYLARNSTLLHVIHLSDDFLDILASFLKLEQIWSWISFNRLLLLVLDYLTIKIIWLIFLKWRN